MNTLLDIAKRNGSDATVGLIEEAVSINPELGIASARSITGLEYKVLIRSKLPNVEFRRANEGVASTKSEYKNKSVGTFILSPRFECDKAVADASEDGAEAFIADEGIAITKSAMTHLCKQFYYGTDADEKGFVGLKETVDNAMIVDAEGTSNGGCSSVFAVKFGPQDVQFVVGNGGDFELSEVRTETITDANGNKFDGYVQTMLAYPGLQVVNKNSVAAIKDIDDTKSLNDDMLSELLEKFPAGVVPDAIFMTRKSRRQLQNSRTATSPTGARVPLPTEIEGVNIVVTDSLVNTENPW